MRIWLGIIAGAGALDSAAFEKLSASAFDSDWVASLV